MQVDIKENLKNETQKKLVPKFLETDFFRSPIPEEEIKSIIYECPKFLGMKYTPPLLNEAATSAVLKNDAALYGIQMALAKLARPIDYYVHMKIKDPIIDPIGTCHPTTRIQGNEDLEFAHTMIELLFDVASSITQNRINSLHNSMEIPGRLGALLAAKKSIAISRKNKRSSLCPRKQTALGTTSATAQTPHNATPNTEDNSLRLMHLNQNYRQQLSQKHSREGIQDSVQESESREAKGFDGEKLYKFQKNKCEATYSKEIKYFFGREAKSNQLLSSANSSFALLQAKIKQGSQQCNHQGCCGFSSKKCNRAGKKRSTGVLQPVLYNTKEDRRSTSSSRFPETQQLCRGKEF
ncbi:hypothetical protein BB561_002971 [Smittium simulii]|uniref:Uncharacterized protein n=1 Tax=Smittium simulii TaxID=133385 RepID=A0A2T9YNH6_9FUNG|nr:hypothetical protein BB561_002971 [Smittium simulii]